MTSLIFASFLIMPAHLADASFFGNYNARPAATVAGELESVSHLPSEGFSLVAQSILDLMKNARSAALQVRALDVLCARSEGPAVEALLGQMQSYLISVPSRASMPETDFVQRANTIQLFLSADLSRWSPGLRTHSGTAEFMKGVAQSPRNTLDSSNYILAVQNLLVLLPSDGARRAALLDIIASDGGGADFASREIIRLMNDDALARLRSLADLSRPNEWAIGALAHVGDTECIPILRRQLAAVEERREWSMIGWIENALRRIELQHPPTNLIEYLRSPGVGRSDMQEWAMRRAVDYGLDRAQVRAAILEWASTAEPLIVASVKRRGISLGLLNPDDLPDAPPDIISTLSICGTYLNRRTEQAPIPERGRKSFWKPNAANYDALTAWFAEQDWAHIPDDEGLRLIRQKACELDLLSPDLCTSYSDPAP